MKQTFFRVFKKSLHWKAFNYFKCAAILSFIYIIFKFHLYYIGSISCKHFVLTSPTAFNAYNNILDIDQSLVDLTKYSINNIDYSKLTFVICICCNI